MSARLASIALAALALELVGSGDRAHAAPRALAEQDLVRVEAKVTSASGSSLYVDVGRDDGVQAGDRVVLYPPGVTSVEGTIRSVAKRSARLELEPGSAPVPEGTRVEVLVPRERIAKPSEPAKPVVTPAPSAPAPVAPNPGATEPPPRTPPVHPPWAHPPETWAAEHPLLAPAFGLKPDERARDVHGRAWVDLDLTTDSVGGTKRYLFGRSGADVRVTNPFGAGGELAFDAEVQHRSFSFPDAPDDTQTDFVLRRFSYAVGGTAEHPTRFEVGRFLAHEFPELGVVDGAEWTLGADGASRVGVNAGGLPEPFAGRMSSFHDYGAALFGRKSIGEDETLRIGGALQNTWHDGAQDRTLVLAETDWRPSPRFAWRGIAWIDHYDSSDTLKSPGFELTELSTQARWRATDDWGASLSASHRRYPELLREDFANLSPVLVQDGKVDRASLALWHAYSRNVRFDARVDAWRDQDDSGSTFELGAAWTDLLLDRSTASLSVFRANGTFSSGVGARASITKAWERAFGMLSLETTSFDQKDFTGVQSSLAHHAVYGSLDLPLGEDWNLSLRAEDRFGDQQSAWSLGMVLQLRF